LYPPRSPYHKTMFLPRLVTRLARLYCLHLINTVSRPTLPLISSTRLAGRHPVFFLTRAVFVTPTITRQAASQTTTQPFHLASTPTSPSEPSIFIRPFSLLTNACLHSLPKLTPTLTLHRPSSDSPRLLYHFTLATLSSSLSFPAISPVLDDVSPLLHSPSHLSATPCLCLLQPISSRLHPYDTARPTH
jgi:hypothetical protein